jgi:hypothetical protein
MLRNGKCPQCGSSDVMTSPQGIGWDGNLMVTRGSVTVSTSDWTTYLCTGCGLFENYVTDQNYLASVQSDPSVGWTRL